MKVELGVKETLKFSEFNVEVVKMTNANFLTLAQRHW